MMENIPIIDFNGLGIDHENVSNMDENLKKKVATEICDAFRNIGFCYLKNHGISDEQVKNLMKVSRDFFEQPVDVKKRYIKAVEEGEYHGWIPWERLSPEKPPDCKESYNYKPNTKNLKAFPEFEEGMEDFFNTCTKLGRRILDAMSLGLNIPKIIIQDTHHLIGMPGNPTTLRTLYYPPVLNDLKDGQMRCAEHSDYGSITLLFQGEGGGLQVRNMNGEFVPANYIPETVLVNIGDLMQHWTADKFVATKHRVVLPDDDKKHMVRQSIAFFVVPDDDALIECLDNSQKYEPVTSGDFLRRRFAKTMK